MARISAKEKIRRFLRTRIGSVVSAHEIQASVGAGVTEWARRLRELRNEEGWRISSHHDRADLKPGEYILEEKPPEQYRFSRPISIRLRSQVLERNGYTCRMCGIAAGELLEDGRHARLHVGHIVDRSHGGPETLDNLRALCSDCKQGAKNIAQEPPSRTWLLAQIRRASESDQRRAFIWLTKKFGDRK